MRSPREIREHFEVETVPLETALARRFWGDTWDVAVEMHVDPTSTHEEAIHRLVVSATELPCRLAEGE